MNKHRTARAPQPHEKTPESAEDRPQSPRSRTHARLDLERAQMNGRATAKQEQIIEAALDLLDSDGLSNLSLREIAKRLNVKAPAIYWYFKNKEDLVDYMAEAILKKEFCDLRPRESDEPWQDWLMAQMVRLRRAMLAYADGGRVVAGARLFPATTLSEIYEQALTSLRSAGLDLPTAYHVAATATRYTFGYVIEEQAAPTPQVISEMGAAPPIASFPLVTEAMSQLESSEPDRDAGFAIGLGYILKGSTAT